MFDNNDLNFNQRKAVMFDGKHLLVLAGAGSGKTKTIIARASYLISKGVNPSKIQILTFTKRAAIEIVERVKSTLNNNQVNLLNGSTFHSWCNQLLNKYPNLFGTKSFTVIDQDDQISIMKMVCGKNSIQFEDLRIKAQGLIDIYSFARNTKRNLTETLRLKLFNNLKNDLVDKKIEEIRPKIELLLKNYEFKKKERKYLDYDDIILVVAIRLQKDPEARKIISSQYEHILVDEMQDTNPLQWDLLNPFQNICNLFCVGDDAQSIYSFRGADFKNVHFFKERVTHSKVYLLEDNYRSTQEILDLSNWLLKKSQINYNKELKSIRGRGFLPTIINVQNEWEEANYISDKIIENYCQRNKLYKDHLILSRSQFYTRTLQAVFIQKKIPYVTYGGRKFMESAHIKDLISALRIVNNIYDEIAWFRFLTFWDGIGEIRASKYINQILEFKNIEECIEWLENLILENEGQLLSKIIKAIFVNKSDLKKAVSETFYLMEDRLSNVYKQDWDNKRKPDFPVLSLLADTYSSLGEFITDCILDNSTTLASSEITKSENKDHVIISTIHSAKGLESDICYVLNVSPKHFPSSWSLGNDDEMEEDRRVLYVALTRAKNELYITRNLNSIYADNIIKMDENTQTNEENVVAQGLYFLNGLPENLVEQIVINKGKTIVKDLESPNELDLTSGFDFS
jgi:DNA helicase-2/ATP-dependent DNA helicase PcrA